VFPLVNILNHKGKVLDKASGYSSLRDPKYYFELLENNK
ncbi:thioredoxin family protein, partial [Aquimarina sp. AD10]